MANFNAKGNQQLNRQLKVQRLSIPFVIVGSATSANVAPSNDEPSIMFIKTAGVDQITAALASGETATYTVSPLDSSGIFNVLLKVQEPVQKVISCQMNDVVTGTTTNACKIGSASGITALSSGAVGQSIMLTCTSALALNAANTCNGVLLVEYIVNER